MTMVLMPRCFDTSIAIWEVCRASSRVGTMIMPWMMSLVGSICSRQGIVYAPVFPVPFFALAKMSLRFDFKAKLEQRVAQTHRPERAIGMLASWIGLGFSQPFSKIP